MKFFILRPIKDVSLWIPWYDKAFGFIVFAANEERARVLASIEAGDEGEEAWINPEYSTCVELLPEGKERVIIKDFAAA